MRAAFFGGVYSNWVALEAALRDAHRRGAEALYCQGDRCVLDPPRPALRLVAVDGAARL